MSELESPMGWCAQCQKERNIRHHFCQSCGGAIRVMNSSEDKEGEGGENKVKTPFRHRSKCDIHDHKKQRLILRVGFYSCCGLPVNY